MKVLITGSRGLLGATLTTVLLEKGYDVTELQADVRDTEALTREVENVRPEVIVHTAALASVAACEAEPKRAEEVNALGTKYVTTAAEKVGAKLIYISTVSVFANPNGNSKENDVPNPGNVYNRTKSEGEKYVRNYAQGLVLRINLIGIHPLGSRGRNFLEWLVDSFSANKDVTLFTDERVNPLSSWTIASYIVKLLSRSAWPAVLHLGSSDVHSKAEIGHVVAGWFPQYHGTITDSVRTQNTGQPQEMWLNVELAESLFGPLPTIEQELDSIRNKSRVS